MIFFINKIFDIILFFNLHSYQTFMSYPAKKIYKKIVLLCDCIVSFRVEAKI